MLRGVSTVDYLGVEAPGQQGARPSRVGGPGEGAERSWPGWIGAQKRPYLRRAALETFLQRCATGPFRRGNNRKKEHAMGDKGQKDKDRNKKKIIKQREDKAAKNKEKNQKPKAGS